VDSVDPKAFTWSQNILKQSEEGALKFQLQTEAYSKDSFNFAEGNFLMEANLGARKYYPVSVEIIVSSVHFQSINFYHYSTSGQSSIPSLRPSSKIIRQNE
tara:strand:+ start:133 stop:435 length:303 start_codon:yes stop_codon:yes gene_type:complete